MLLAVATSAAVLYVGAVGAFTAPLAVAAGFGALLIAAISTRQSRPTADLLLPLSSEAGARSVVIDAPPASDLAGGVESHTDAA